MFKILQKTWNAGIVTRGAWPASREAVFPETAPEACPTGAISRKPAVLDYGRCIFCGQCGGLSAGSNFALAARDRQSLVVGPDAPPISPAVARREIHRVLGRSLAVREVDSGSCNACELEIVALNNPVYDIERFGIHFVASPRHADMLLVTGPVTRNMELALRKTYNAAPDPKLVVAAGACAISGGLFGENYATVGAVDRVLPVDVYIPGCPPRPEALLYGILLAVGRAPDPPPRF